VIVKLLKKLNIIVYGECFELLIFWLYMAFRIWLVESGL